MANHPIFYPTFHGDHGRVKAMLKADATLVDVRTGVGLTPLQVAASRGHCQVVKVLLAAGAKVQQTGAAGTWTPLVWASYRGHTAMVALLLERGADPSERGGNPIHYAAQRGHQQICQLLVQHGAVDGVVVPSDRPDELALFRAVFSCDAEAVRRILERRPELVDARSRDHRTALHEAALTGDLPTLRTLLDAGADPSATDRTGQTPVERAALHRQRAAAALLEKAAAAAGRSTSGTPRASRAGTRGSGKKQLQVAIDLGDLAAVEALITAEPSRVDSRNPHGNTPILQAIEARQLAVAQLLLKRGADPHQRNHGGWGLMDAAARPGGEAFVKLLRDRGVLFELHHAVGLGDLSQLAARLDADPSLVHAVVGRRRSHPLHIAARDGQLEAAKLLLERGAAVDPLDKEGFTPLAVLAAYCPESRRPELARVLLQHGARVDARCGYSGLDVLGYAVSKRDHALVEVLQPGKIRR